MKNEKESKEKIRKSSSSTSEVVESVDLTTAPPTTSIEPNALLAKPCGSITASQASRSERTTTNENAVEPELTKAQHTAVHIFEVALDEAFQRPTTSGPQFPDLPLEPGGVNRLTSSQPNLRGPRTDFQVLRSAGGLINSTNAMHSENYVKKASSRKSVARIPPSYSTVLKLGPPVTQFDSRTYPSIPFITRQPPPSYAEVHGGWEENPSMVSGDSFSLGPNPLYISCPRCRTIVVSDVHTERSHLAYIVSLVLCVCLCWPCCLLPFCLKSCRNTYHFCPTCHYYLGVYRPW